MTVGDRGPGLGAGDYRRDGLVVVRGLLGPDMAGYLTTYLKVITALDRLHGDRDVPDALSVYGDPALDALLPTLAGRVRALVGAAVVPTYSYARLYFRDQELRPHRDRPACEHSLTVHLGASAPTPWPVGFEAADGRRLEFDLGPGDAVLYRGVDLLHWRSGCPVDWYAQVFLHYVAADGPHAAEAYDRRDRLGLPRPGARVEARTGAAHGS
jgi:hypothetical protein